MESSITKIIVKRIEHGEGSCAGCNFQMSDVVLYKIEEHGIFCGECLLIECYELGKYEIKLVDA